MNSSAPAQVTPLPVAKSAIRLDPLVLCIFIPLLTWVVSYAQMALKYHDIWLFNNVVHENGVLTLTGTILYFNHFMRELPIEAMWAVFGVGVFLALGPCRSRSIAEDQRRQWVAILAIVLAAYTILTIAGSIQAVTLKGTVLELAQARNRDEMEWSRGPHWRNHLLSNIASFGWFVFLVWAYRFFWEGRRYTASRTGRNLILGSLVFYVLASLAFGFNSDPFVNPQYLGHQFREILGNKIPLSSLILLGTLIYWERKTQSSEMNQRESLLKRNLGWSWGLWSLVILVIPTLYLAIAILASGHVGTGIAKASGGRDWSVIDLFAFHYYEHILDHIFVMVLASVIYLVSIERAGKAEIKA